MPKRTPTAEGAVLRFFRFSKGPLGEDLAGKIRVSADTMRNWEYGDVPLSRAELEEILAPLDVPPAAIEAALLAHRLGILPEEPGLLPLEEHRLLHHAAGAGASAGTETAFDELSIDRERQRASQHSLWADAAWPCIKKMKPDEQNTLAGVLAGDERSWALTVRICAASVSSAGDNAKEALRLAQLAVRLAEAAPGPENWRLRLLGYAEPFESNALRVGGDLPAARQAFARADEHWSLGEGGDPAGLLDPTRRLDLKASLAMTDGRFEEALSLLQEALNGARTDHKRGRFLVMEARALEMSGEYEAALEVLEQAEPLLDERRDPRLPCVLLFNRATNYCHLDCYREAESLLPRIETMVEDLRTELDGWRLLGLKGKIWGGLGRKEEGLRVLSRVRQYFLSEKIAFDFALVTLEIATLYLEEGRAREVGELAEEMLWIFKSQAVHKEALAALAIFCKAAGEERAQAEWTRRLVKYLYRAQHNPTLRFEP